MSAAEIEKINISDLVIETTRQCNLKCDHCLRGKSEGVNIRHNYIGSLLDCVEDYISTITFTGGEPSLYPSAIWYFIESCKARNIAVGNFFISTNGIKHRHSTEFMEAILALHVFCDDNEASGLRVSNDHEHLVSAYGLELENSLISYDMFTFTIKQMPKDGQIISPQSIINEGSQLENHNRGKSLDVDEISIENSTIQGMLYLNALGFLINGCDWSYESQRTREDITIGHVDNIRDLVDAICSCNY